jgi:hypothetical protein
MPLLVLLFVPVLDPQEPLVLPDLTVRHHPVAVEVGHIKDAVFL